MNKIKILFKNFQEWQVVLALPIFDALLRQGFNVYFDSSAGVLSRLLDRFNITVIRDGEKKISTAIWTQIEPWQEGQKTDFAHKKIRFPILTKDQLHKYLQSQNEAYFLPLSPQPYLDHYLGDVQTLVDFIYYANTDKPLQGKRILITGGPTAEDIDPVRFITNRSSGKMGLALARAAFLSGAKVTLILGPTDLVVPLYLDCVQVRSAQQMAEAVFERFDETDIYIGAAAVADFKPAHWSEQKIKKEENAHTLQLELTRTVDILKELQARKKHQMVIGFSVETEHEIENSRKKLENKKLDAIVINNPKHKGAAFNQDTNKVLVLTKQGQIFDLPLMSKFDLALKIMDLLSKWKGEKWTKSK